MVIKMHTSMFGRSNVWCSALLAVITASSHAQYSKSDVILLNDAQAAFEKKDYIRAAMWMTALVERGSPYLQNNPGFQAEFISALNYAVDEVQKQVADADRVAGLEEDLDRCRGSKISGIRRPPSIPPRVNWSAARQTGSNYPQGPGNYPPGTDSHPPAPRANSCEPIILGTTCWDFYRERSNWDAGKISRCGLYQVSRYKEALNIRSDAAWSRFISQCK